MASTLGRSVQPDGADTWRCLGLRYFPYGFYLRQRFGQRVHKISVDAGFTCPNVDGRVAHGGCTFCDNRSFSPSRRLPPQSIRNQIEEGIRRTQRRYASERFIAYFQPATNTYAPVDRLQSAYREAAEHPRVVGLAIGTRADCVPDEVLRLLEAFSTRTFLSVEYGLQTIHDRSLQWMNRGHDYASVRDAVERSRNRGFRLGVHVILGLPGESHAEMLATAVEVSRLQLDFVKIHNLHAVRNTRLAEQVAHGEVRLMERDEYVEVLVDFLERLPPSMVIERVGGDAPPEFLVAPAWCLDKPGLHAALQAELTRRDSWQGKRCVEMKG